MTSPLEDLLNIQTSINVWIILITILFIILLFNKLFISNSVSKIINSKLVKSDKWYSKMFNNKYFKLVEDLNKKYYYFIFIILSIVIIFMCLLNIFISIELNINLDD